MHVGKTQAPKLRGNTILLQRFTSEEDLSIYRSGTFEEAETPHDLTLTSPHASPTICDHAPFAAHPPLRGQPGHDEPTIRPVVD